MVVLTALPARVSAFQEGGDKEGGLTSRAVKLSE